MPVMDGHEAIRRIRAMAGGKEPKIIAVTASAMDENRQELMEIGADDFISKPFREAELFQKIHAHVGVEYVYAEHPAAAAQEEAAELTPESLAGWPQDLIDPMREAVITADLDQLLARIQEVEARDPRIAQGLRRLAEGFQYQKLLDLFSTEGVPLNPEKPEQWRRATRQHPGRGRHPRQSPGAGRHAQGPRVQGPPRSQRQAGAAGGAARSPGPDPAGHQHAGDERLRGVRTPQSRRHAQGDSRHLHQRPHRAAGQGEGVRHRRGGLPHQAVSDGRTARPRRDAPEAPPPADRVGGDQRATGEGQRPDVPRPEGGGEDPGDVPAPRGAPRPGHGVRLGLPALRRAGRRRPERHPARRRQGRAVRPGRQRPRRRVGPPVGDAEPPPLAAVGPVLDPDPGAETSGIGSTSRRPPRSPTA